MIILVSDWHVLNAKEPIDVTLLSSSKVTLVIFMLSSNAASPIDVTFYTVPE